MTKFNRVKNLLIGVLLFLFVGVMLLVPRESYAIVAMIVSISLLVYGFRQLWYYFTMARHMVGGKSTLFQAIILLDVALLTTTMISMSSLVIVFYLLGIYAFSGVVDILRGLDAKKNGAASWRFKLISGVLNVLFALALVIIGWFIGDTGILVYGYCISPAYSAVMRIINAFRKTEIVYIQ